VTAGYSGTPLPKKLGIKDGSRVALLGAPKDFETTLGSLPPRVVIRATSNGEADVILLFVTKFSRLKTEFGKAMRMMPPDGGMLWVAWPKKAAKMDTDLDENFIRDFGLAAGVVDTKVCAIDETWSGLRFSRRRAK
jgi:hypothetical protein